VRSPIEGVRFEGGGARAGWVRRISIGIQEFDTASSFVDNIADINFAPSCGLSGFGF
jgi:hypothetical protein